MTLTFRALPSGPVPPCTHRECRERPRGPRPACWLVEVPGVQPQPRCVSHCAAAASARGIPFPPTDPVA